MSEITHIVRAVINPFRDHGEYATTWCNEKILWTKPSRSIDQALVAMDDDVAGAYPTCLHCLAAAHAAIGEHLGLQAPEPVYASLEVAHPPRIVEYRVVARDSISDLELMVNQMIGYGWQPYGTPITTHGFWYQPMVKHATSGTSSEAA